MFIRYNYQRRGIGSQKKPKHCQGSLRMPPQQATNPYQILYSQPSWRSGVTDSLYVQFDHVTRLNTLDFLDDLPFSIPYTKLFQKVNIWFFDYTAQNPAIVPCSRTALCKAFLFGLAIEDARALRCSSNSGRSPDCALRVNLQQQRWGQWTRRQR